MLTRLDQEHWGDRVTHSGQTEDDTVKPPQIHLVFDDGDSDKNLQVSRSQRTESNKTRTDSSHADE